MKFRVIFKTITLVYLYVARVQDNFLKLLFIRLSMRRVLLISKFQSNQEQRKPEATRAMLQKGFQDVSIIFHTKY